MTRNGGADRLTSTKGLVLYLVAGLLLAGLMIVLRAPLGTFVALLLPYITIGIILWAARRRR